MNAFPIINNFPYVALACFVASLLFFFLLLPRLPGVTANDRVLPASLLFATLHVLGLAIIAPPIIGVTIIATFWGALGSAMGGHGADGAYMVVTFGSAVLFVSTYLFTYFETILLSKLFGNALLFSKKSVLYLSIVLLLFVEFGTTVAVLVPKAMAQSGVNPPQEGRTR